MFNMKKKTKTVARIQFEVKDNGEVYIPAYKLPTKNALTVTTALLQTALAIHNGFVAEVQANQEAAKGQSDV